MFRDWEAEILLACVAVMAAMLTVLFAPTLGFMDMPLSIALLCLVGIVVLARSVAVRRATAISLVAILLCSLLSRCV